jgi:hypothetical protein
MSKRIRWANVPTIVIYEPACKACWSKEYEITRTEQSGDGSKIQKVICQRCGQPYKILTEPLPEIGNFPTGHG